MFSAIKGLCRQLPVEKGPNGIRVVCLRSTGSPEAAGVQELLKLHAETGNMRVAELIKKSEETSPPRKPASLEDVGDAAALMASD